MDSDAGVGSLGLSTHAYNCLVRRAKRPILTIDRLCQEDPRIAAADQSTALRPARIPIRPPAVAADRGRRRRTWPPASGAAKRVMAAQPRRLRPSGMYRPAQLRHGPAGLSLRSRRRPGEVAACRRSWMLVPSAPARIPYARAAVAATGGRRRAPRRAAGKRRCSRAVCPAPLRPGGARCAHFPTTWPSALGIVRHRQLAIHPEAERDTAAVAVIPGGTRNPIRHQAGGLAGISASISSSSTLRARRLCSESHEPGRRRRTPYSRRQSGSPRRR